MQKQRERESKRGNRSKTDEGAIRELRQLASQGSTSKREDWRVTSLDGPEFKDFAFL
jgi:hypothetical protein